MENKIKAARQSVGLTQRQLAELLAIPIRTIEAWDAGDRTPPPYVERLVVAEILRQRETG